MNRAPLPRVTLVLGFHDLAPRADDGFVILGPPQPSQRLPDRPSPGLVDERIDLACTRARPLIRGVTP